MNVKSIFESAEQLLSIDDLNGFHTSTSRLLEGCQLCKPQEGQQQVISSDTFDADEKIESKGKIFMSLSGNMKQIY